jgi:ribosome-associated translation inhibitor RaiA
LSEASVAVRTSGVSLDERTRARVDERIGRALGKFASRIQRVTVRFRDLNGPRGGVDQACRIKVVMRELPSLVAEERARTPREALDRAAAVVSRAVRRSLERSPLRSPGGEKRRPAAARPEGSGAPERRGTPEGSLIGRRVGRSAERLRLAAERPEKLRRDAWVDTAQPATSASDRKVGAGSTARRNTKLNLAGMTSMLEDSASGRPSRKSTRRSAGRAKRDSALRLRATARATSPEERARKPRARGPARHR